MMPATTALDNSVALSVLRAMHTKHDETGWNYAVFSAKSGDLSGAIADAFSSNTELAKQFNAAYTKAMDRSAASGKQISPDNGKHIALVEVIVANRDAFPPEEFQVYTKLASGGSILTTVPSKASMMGEITQRKIAEKQAAYDAETAARNSQADPGMVKLEAMAKVVKSLVLDAQDPNANPGQTAVQILQQEPRKEEADAKKDAEPAVEMVVSSYVATEIA